MKRLFVFGLGYTASAIAKEMRAEGWIITASGGGQIPFDDEERVRQALAQANYVLSSVPPVEGVDPVLTRYGDALRQDWLGYLSSTGVYGDVGGAWVDETASIGTGRRAARAEADAAWLSRGARVFRLPGIYGPGRSALERVRAGKAHRIDLPGQVFSRVHVADIAAGVTSALVAPPGAYNLGDDHPCEQNAVIEEACQLLGLPVPALQSLDEAGLSAAARSFYAENRRVANGRAKRVLGWRPKFPTYREGLRSLV